MRAAAVSLAVSLGVWLAAATPAGAPGPPSARTITRLAIILAEDAKASTPDQLQLLVQAAMRGTPDHQAMAVRAIGRLERPELVATLAALLDAVDTRVRAETANALAQAAGKDADSVRIVRGRLFDRLMVETSPDVRGAIGEALGRLPNAVPADAPDVERALLEIASRPTIARRLSASPAGGGRLGVSLAPTKEITVPAPALIGALRGFESLARARGRGQPFSPDTVSRLKALASAASGSSAVGVGVRATKADAARARRLALLCLLAVGAVDEDLARVCQDDPDEQVRRLAVSAPAAARATVERALNDPAWLVRYEALRVFGRRFQATDGCVPILSAIGAGVDHVALLAIDLLAGSCRPEDQAVDVLLDLAAGVEASREATKATSPAAGPDVAGIRKRSWHWPAHAIVSLARVAPERARPIVQRFLAAEPWQTRMYAARAAAQMGDIGALRVLAADTHHNVREAAISGLNRTVKHEADAIYIQALAAGDHQLVMTAAGALTGTPEPRVAVPALLSALARLTALDSDTTRDPRVAILERLRDLGSRDQADSLAPYLRDPDPRVAELTARMLTSWTGNPAVASPLARAAPAPDVTDADLVRLAKTTVRVTMAGGGQFDLRLMVDLAPISCVRFARLAAQGYYNGLTFHRVIPNFLIQGGSPGANEFAGDRRYMRDEVGRVTQTRGTVGISTRGRDTGDAQFYINLVDTPRLDHDYTVFAEVVRGMDVVDRILEGDVIEKVDITRK